MPNLQARGVARIPLVGSLCARVGDRCRGGVVDEVVGMVGFEISIGTEYLFFCKDTKCPITASPRLSIRVKYTVRLALYRLISAGEGTLSKEVSSERIQLSLKAFHQCGFCIKWTKYTLVEVENFV